MGIFLCLAAFVITFVASRRSVVAGLSSLVAIGYFYGILRANYPQAATHFSFDAGVAAFYLVHLFGRQDPDTRSRSNAILPWFAILIAWPAFLAFFPLQDPLVQLVGLRANIFLLPFLLIGARLKRQEIYQLATAIAALNLIALVFAGFEYWMGIELFFPHNANTELIYRSADVANSQFRIPSIFTGSHAYAGTMVVSLPFLIGAWAAPAVSIRRHIFLLAGIMAGMLGVFVAAARVHTVVLGIVILAALFSGRINLQTRAVVLAAVSVIAIVVLSQARLQRFTTLQDSGLVSQRIGGSVNANFFELLLEHPLGNGLGGGGTSLPFFLENRLRNKIVMENEYARIMLEETPLGLCLWIAFIIWFISRRFAPASRLWGLTEELGWAVTLGYFATGLLGIGLFTSIPQTMLLMICAGAATSWRLVEFPVVEEAALAYTNA
jgi:hypothetical protein